MCFWLICFHVFDSQAAGRPAPVHVFVPLRQVRSRGFISCVNSSRLWRFWKCGRAWLSYIMDCTVAALYALVLRSWNTEKRKQLWELPITNQKYTDKKILAPVRTPEDITIKYLNCIRTVARKATVSFVMFACRPVRVKQLLSQWIDFGYILYWEMLLQSFWENASWVNIGQNIGPFTCDLVLLLEETTLGRNIANIFGQDCTITSRGRLLYRVRMKRLWTVRARPYISCVSFVAAVVKAVVSPLKWSMLRLFHRHA